MIRLVTIACHVLAEPTLTLDHERGQAPGEPTCRITVSDPKSEIEGVASLVLKAADATARTCPRDGAGVRVVEYVEGRRARRVRVHPPG